MRTARTPWNGWDGKESIRTRCSGNVCFHYVEGHSINGISYRRCPSRGSVEASDVKILNPDLDHLYTRTHSHIRRNIYECMYTLLSSCP